MARSSINASKAKKRADVATPFAPVLSASNAPTATVGRNDPISMNKRNTPVLPPQVFTPKEKGNREAYSSIAGQTAPAVSGGYVEPNWQAQTEPTTPTVASSANPVIVRTPATTASSEYTAPDYSTVEGMDMDGLQSYIDTVNMKASRGQQPTEAEQLNLMKAIRQMQAMGQQAQTDGYAGRKEAIITQRDSELARIKRQSDTLYDANQREIEASFARQKAEQERAGQKTMQAVKGALSFSGFGRSTYAAEKQAEVQDTVNANISNLEAQREASLAKAQAERNGATQEVLNSYDTYIQQLEGQSQEFRNEMVTKMNEYNQQNTMDYQEKVNNIMQLASQFEESQTPLTSEEMITADSYATLAIDSKGEINEALLKGVPSKLLGAVLKKAAELKGAIPTGGTEYGFINAGGGMIAVTDPVTGEVRYEQGEVPEEEKKFKSVVVDGTPYSFDETTGQFVEGGGATGDLRSMAGQFPGQARAKNNNPAGITWNANFDNPQPGTTAYALDQAGVSYEKGTARPASEGGNYVTFPTIEDGLKAQQIIMTQTYGDSTVGSMLGSWVGTSEASNYAKQVAGNAGIDLNRKVSELTPEELGALQYSKIQKESPGLAKLLVQETIEEGATKDEPDTDFKNQSESKAYGFAVRTTDSNKILDKIEEEELMNKSRSASAFSLKKQKLLPNLLEAEWYQSYQQAQRDFINAILRQESGAAIADSEFDSASKQYFAQPGDSKATLEQKRSNRKTAIDALKKQAGNKEWFDWYDKSDTKNDIAVSSATQENPPETQTIDDIWNT